MLLAVTTDPSLLVIPINEFTPFTLFISTFEFSPTLISLSFTLLKVRLLAVTSDPEKSIASFPIFENLLLLITPLLKSKSIESEAVSSKKFLYSKI